ncbi:hypothetical protein DOK_12011 [gamma proteobacterium BDW918]|nr:hypothetical protein DOK_12011 [gamma proteobacterium BDW918]
MKVDWEKELVRVLNAVFICAVAYAIWLTILPIFLPANSPTLIGITIFTGIGAAVFSSDFGNFKEVPRVKYVLIGGLVAPIWVLIRYGVLGIVRKN